MFHLGLLFLANCHQVVIQFEEEKEEKEEEEEEDKEEDKEEEDKVQDLNEQGQINPI